MSSLHSVASKLPPDARQQLALKALAGNDSMVSLAEEENVSRQFVLRQKRIAELALNQAFSPAEASNEVLFYLPVTQLWLNQLVICLILVCHSSYRGVVRLMQDLLDTSMSTGFIHNLLKTTASQAAQINISQDLSLIKVGLLDELFQGNQPVLTGIDADSTYCYLLAEAQHRDETTWAVHLLDAKAQGLNPDYTIADAGSGLRAGQRAAFGTLPCHGDVFHILQQCETLSNLLKRIAKGVVSRRQHLEIRMAQAVLKGQGNRLSAKLVTARKAETRAVNLAKDVSILVGWLSRDILALAGPIFAERCRLYDFIVAELSLREPLDSARIRPLRIALERQRNQLLRFASVLDAKLNAIAEQFNVSNYHVRAICLLQRKPKTSAAYWQRRDQINHQLGAQCHAVFDAVLQAMDNLHRCSSMVENLNGQLRNYFFLRRGLGQGYLDMLRFYLNHRTFMRSRKPERVEKSPKQLMTGQSHPHWLELLGFELFRRPSAIR